MAEHLSFDLELEQLSGYEFKVKFSDAPGVAELLLDDGKLRPIVGKVFDFTQTPQALQSLAKGGIRGKAVVTHADFPPPSTHRTTNPDAEV